jgi:D-glycero-D-manno-heptose 1,7-bisphosphate phosphatase
MPGTNKAILLDRDGTLIRELHYLHEPDKVVLERNVATALRRLQDAGYLLIVVTNQSGIGRGLFGEEDYRAVQARLTELLAAEGVRLAGAYHCPHHPTEARGEYLRECDCRKPGTGMVEAALRDHGLDRERSFLVGDNASDIGAGVRAGLRSVLVRTGYGAEHERLDGPYQPDHVADDLDQAADYILGAG